jgi:hypothetical protein
MKIIFLAGISFPKKPVTVSGDKPVDKIADKSRNYDECIKDFPGSAKIIKNVEYG